VNLQSYACSADRAVATMRIKLSIGPQITLAVVSYSRYLVVILEALLVMSCAILLPFLRCEPRPEGVHHLGFFGASQEFDATLSQPAGKAYCERVGVRYLTR